MGNWDCIEAEISSWSVFEVTLWKESVDGLWACISDVNKGQGGMSAVTEGQQNEQWRVFHRQQVIMIPSLQCVLNRMRTDFI